MKVALFLTCVDQMFSPQVGIATVKVLERLGCNIHFPKNQTCCGQVTYNSGYRKEAIKGIKQTILAFQQADYVVTPSGSCAAMIKQYPALLQEESHWYKRAKELKNKTYEFTQFIVERLQITNVGATLREKATFHTSCHMLRLLGVNDAPFTLLNKVAGLQLEPLENSHDCCGFGGGFSVHMPSISKQMVDEKIKHIEQTGANIIIGADSSCLLNIKGRIDRLQKPIDVLHIAEVLNNVKGDDKYVIKNEYKTV